ncbi:hypothetical protein HELRODRAFT_181213 [Helobdella robusta]|uniref:Uncharacterized protein n=1 Tax=Helobdella robusta TaxID=6412 RepID=T1FGR2_HELRO|nr:hypothetical protein HELRODRAFT_181213 [Helobdella robusta]ESN93118.1 hypothetical protein HELRODRAFT_181213 [Helobdella robusta]
MCRLKMFSFNKRYHMDIAALMLPEKTKKAGVIQPNGPPGGGVVIILKDSYRSTKIDIKFNLKTLEYLCVSSLSYGSSIISWVAIYRPGSSQIISTFFDEFRQLLEKLTKLGDTNAQQRFEFKVHSIMVDQPIISDHSLIYDSLDIEQKSLVCLVNKKRSESLRKHKLFAAKEQGNWESLITSNSGNSKVHWSIVSSLMGKKKTGASPTESISASDYLGYILSKSSTTSGVIPVDHSKYQRTDCRLDHFDQISCDDFKSVILSTPSKSCLLDPVPTFILKELLGIPLPFLLQASKMSLLLKNNNNNNNNNLNRDKAKQLKPASASAFWETGNGTGKSVENEYTSGPQERLRLCLFMNPNYLDAKLSTINLVVPRMLYTQSLHLPLCWLKLEGLVAECLACLSTTPTTRVRILQFLQVYPVSRPLANPAVYPFEAGKWVDNVSCRMLAGEMAQWFKCSLSQTSP